jgi:hypothetical protein
MQVLLHDDLGRLTLRRLRPWHRVLARSRAAWLDRELAGGMDPEASAILAARAIRLTSTDFRRDLAASLQRIVAARQPPAVLRPWVGAARLAYADGDARLGRANAGHPARPRPGTARSTLVAARPPRIPLPWERISQCAPLLAELASRLVESGPVPVQGVAMVTRLLADGMGPLYRETCRDDLNAIIERATHALTS